MDSADLVTFEHPLPGERRLVALASADLALQAGSLLDTLAALDARGPRLADGSTVLFGWSRLTLRQRGPSRTLHVHEPDFFSDAETQTVAHVDATLRVLRDQADLLHRAGATPLDTLYHQSVVCERGALEEDECYFERRNPVSDRDSGWLAGSAEPASRHETLDAFDLITLPAYRLLREFPAAMAILTLPVGYLGVFRFDRLTTLLRPDGSPVPLLEIETQPHSTA